LNGSIAVKQMKITLRKWSVDQTVVCAPEPEMDKTTTLDSHSYAGVDNEGFEDTTNDYSNFEGSSNRNKEDEE